MNVPSGPIIDTHTFADDPPHALSSVSRWTCTQCGRAILTNGPVIYGSATQAACDAAEEQQ